MTDKRAQLAGIIFAIAALCWGGLVFAGQDETAAFNTMIHEVTHDAWIVFIAYLQPPKESP